MHHPHNGVLPPGRPRNARVAGATLTGQNFSPESSRDTCVIRASSVGNGHENLPTGDASGTLTARLPEAFVGRTYRSDRCSVPTQPHGRTADMGEKPTRHESKRRLASGRSRPIRRPRSHAADTRRTARPWYG